MPEGSIEQPLRWPTDWPRTPLQARKSQNAWKALYSQVMQRLTKELKLAGATSWLVTHNDINSPDSGVAVYFTLKPVENYGWQEALDFVGKVPTVQQIDHAYMEKIRSTGCHTDGPKPDPVLFFELTKHRDRARAWARGEQLLEHDKVIPIDAFKEVRLNLNAIRMTLFAMRQLERCGAPVMMDRAWRGFSKQISAGPGEPV